MRSVAPYTLFALFSGSVGIQADVCGTPSLGHAALIPGCEPGHDNEVTL